MVRQSSIGSWWESNGCSLSATPRAVLPTDVSSTSWTTTRSAVSPRIRSASPTRGRMVERNLYGPLWGELGTGLDRCLRYAETFVTLQRIATLQRSTMESLHYKVIQGGGGWLRRSARASRTHWQRLA